MLKFLLSMLAWLPQEDICTPLMNLGANVFSVGFVQLTGVDDLLS